MAMPDPINTTQLFGVRIWIARRGPWDSSSAAAPSRRASAELMFSPLMSHLHTHGWNGWTRQGAEHEDRVRAGERQR
jgi:hypothetical protein